MTVHELDRCYHVGSLLRAIVSRVLLASLICIEPALAASPANYPPALDGVWQVVSPIKQLRTIDGAAPPLLPAAQKIYDRRVAQMKAGDLSYDASLTGCKPLGEPRTAYEGLPFEILQGADRILFTYTWNRMVRFIDLKDQFSDIPGPMYYGTSIGKWDGEVLRVTTRKINHSTLLDAAGMPHSDALELSEQFKLKDGGATLEERMTFNDPETFSKSWEAVVTYKKLAGARIAEDVCLERRNITLKAPGAG